MICLLLLSHVCLSVAADSDTEQEEKIKIEQNVWENDTLKMAYITYLPKDYDPEKSYRLIVLMHGAGERGFDFNMLLSVDYGFVTAFKEEAAYHENTILLIPQCPIPYLWVEDSWASGAYTMTEEPSPAIAAVKQLIAHTLKEYSVDKSRIYTVGISMGGMAVWDMLARYPDLFAAAAPICGCLDESKTEEYEKTPIFTANDIRDTIVGAAPTARVAEALKALGADIVYKQYDTDIRNDTSYHSTWIDAFTLDKSEDNVYNFIFSHQRIVGPEEEQTTDTQTAPSTPSTTESTTETETEVNTETETETETEIETQLKTNDEQNTSDDTEHSTARPEKQPIYIIASLCAGAVILLMALLVYRKHKYKEK